MRSYDLKVLLIILVMTAGIIFINGMTTDVSLGDESHHYHLTENIYRAGKRLAFDPLYESGNPPGFFYNDPPLWHLSVATLWKIRGGPSQAIAQLFQLLFFVLLVWMTYLLAKEGMGEREKWFPAFIVATVPMVVSFSTILYMDVPVAALSAWSCYSILKRRYLQGGIAASLAFFTKLNAAFFFPGFLFLILWNERKNVWGMLKNFALFILPILLIHVPDRQWRHEHIISKIDHTNWRVLFERVAGGFRGLGQMFTGGVKEYFNSYLTNPIDVGKYFGLALLLLIFFYVIYYKRLNHHSRLLWIPLISYLLVFVGLFGIRADIRYLIPILPFLAAAIAPAYHYLRRNWRMAMIGLCLLQFVSTTYYVHQMRQISPGVKEGFEYVRNHVPENALILYPEENLLLYGHRRMVWSSIRSIRSGQSGIYSILWTPNPKEMEMLLEFNKIDYVLIKKSRIHDEQKEFHAGGYPRLFVERIAESDRWTKVFENSDLTLWKAAT